MAAASAAGPAAEAAATSWPWLPAAAEPPAGAVYPNARSACALTFMKHKLLVPGFARRGGGGGEGGRHPEAAESFMTVTVTVTVTPVGPLPGGSLSSDGTYA